jgi:hypothetical protein
MQALTSIKLLLNDPTSPQWIQSWQSFMDRQWQYLRMIRPCPGEKIEDIICPKCFTGLPLAFIGPIQDPSLVEWLEGIAPEVYAYCIFV